MNSKLFALLTLIAVILIAGCIENNINAYPGVSITDFSPTISTVRAGSPIELRVVVQNFGFFDAENANVIIFNCGPSSTGRSDGLPLNAVYNCNGNVFASNFNLLKPDREAGIAGDLKEAEVSLSTIPDDFPQGRSSQTFSARVIYDYSTTGAADVTFTTFQNWKEKGGRIIAQQLNAFSTAAPLTLLLNVPQEPIIVDNPAAANFTVGLSIRNTGQGFVTPEKTLEKIKLCYDSDFVEPLRDERNHYYDFQELEINPTGNNCLVIPSTNETAKLVGLTNQYRDVDARFRNVLGKIKIQDSTTFDAELTYTYTFDRSTTVTILNA